MHACRHPTCLCNDVGLAARDNGPILVQARYRWLSSAGQSQDLPGSWRIHPLSLPRSQVPAGSSALTLTVRRCCPQARHARDASSTGMSGLNHAASISAAYASSDALPHPHARLASGRWLAFAGWESNPLDSIEKFLFVTSNFLLSQAYPGASLDPSHPVRPGTGRPVSVTVTRVASGGRHSTCAERHE